MMKYAVIGAGVSGLSMAGIVEGGAGGYKVRKGKRLYFPIGIEEKKCGKGEEKEF